MRSTSEKYWISSLAATRRVVSQSPIAAAQTFRERLACRLRFGYAGAGFVRRVAADEGWRRGELNPCPEGL
jgi:hypothetical protein